MKIQGTSSEIAEAVFAVIDMERQREDIPLTDAPINMVANDGLTEWARQEADKERRYLAFLSEIKAELHDLLSATHTAMTDIHGNHAASDGWKELYILTRQMHAMIDTVDLYQRHTYPPF